MGQKVNPHVIRLGVVFNWSSRWFDERTYKDVVLEDYGLRTMLMQRLKSAGVASVEIERSINSLKNYYSCFTSRYCYRTGWDRA